MINYGMGQEQLTPDWEESEYTQDDKFCAVCGTRHREDTEFYANRDNEQVCYDCHIEENKQIDIEQLKDEDELLLLAFINSIFDYETESGSRIVDFERTPEEIVNIFLTTNKINQL